MFTFEYSKSTRYPALNEEFYNDLRSNFDNENLRKKFLDNGILGIDLGNLKEEILVERFYEISDCFGSGAVRDAMRRRDLKDKSINLGKVAAVDPDDVHRPHAEASFSPAKPAVICFICIDIEEKAINSGNTTILDGKKIWKELDIQTKKCLLNSEIIYELAIDIPATSKNSKNIRRDWYLDAIGVKNVEIDSGLGKMYMEFKTPFVTEHPLFRELAITNHAFINPDTENQIIKRQIILNKDFSGLETEIKNNVLNSLQNNIKVINWRKGRCLFIDNYRYMHGRLPYNLKLKRNILIKQLKKFKIR